MENNGYRIDLKGFNQKIQDNIINSNFQNYMRLMKKKTGCGIIASFDEKNENYVQSNMFGSSEQIANLLLSLLMNHLSSAPPQLQILNYMQVSNTITQKIVELCKSTGIEIYMEKNEEEDDEDY